MKRIAIFLAIAIAAISCVQEEVVTPEIKVTTAEEDLVLTSDEGMLPIAFSVNVDWTAAVKEPEAKEWCAFSPSKGGKPGDNILNVICIENKGTDNRTATIIIKAMDVVQEIVVTQLQKDVLVLTANKEYDLPYKGDTLTFKVAHNLDLKVKSNAEWIKEVKTKTLVEETVTYVVDFNEGEARSGKITFTADPFEEEIVINQAPWELEFDVDPAEDKAFDAKGGEHVITVDSNVPYAVKLEEVDWLSMTEKDGVYTFTAQPNTDLKARQTTVRIAPKSAKYIQAAKVVVLSQKGAGAKLNISETEVSITCLEQTFELAVDANIAYEMSYKSSVDGEYVDVDPAENWLSLSVSGDICTFSAPANDSWEERSIILLFTPVDAAYADMEIAVVVRQYGHAFKMWWKQIAAIEGYDTAQKLRLARYADKLLLANTTNVYVLNPATGEVESTISMPEGVQAHSLAVDDAGNVLIASDGAVDTEMVIYCISDPMNPDPEILLTYHTGNYYGAETGNIRVRGNIYENAVITAVVSDGQDGENLEDGAVLVWEIVDGEFREAQVGESTRTWHWTNVPYTAWNVASLCCCPAGDSVSDGLFYIGYGGDYNLMYAMNPVLNPVKADVAEGEAPSYVESTSWATSHVTGSSWQENYNCISTATWKGKEYAAILLGCHFNYDDADMRLLDVDNPSAASLVYEYSGTYDVERNSEWVNLWWNYPEQQTKYHYSDILLVPTEEALLMIGADSAYGTIVCVAIM